MTEATAATATAGVAVLILDKSRFLKKIITKNKEYHFIEVKMLILHWDITIQSVQEAKT